MECGLIKPYHNPIKYLNDWSTVKYFNWNTVNHT